MGKAAIKSFHVQVLKGNFHLAIVAIIAKLLKKVSKNVLPVSKICTSLLLMARLEVFNNGYD